MIPETQLTAEEIEQAKKLLSEIHPPEEFDALNDRLIDAASNLTPEIDMYNIIMEEGRKKKRALDDEIADAKLKLRPLENMRDDLLMYAKRADRKKWEMIREMKARKI